MSGSLEIRGDLGKWNATTANNSLYVSQSLLSFSVFLNVKTLDGGSFNPIIFSSTVLSAIRLQFNFFNQFQFFVGGITTFFTHSTAIPPPPGTTVHFGVTLNAAGTSKIYYNGVLIASASSVGVTQATACGITVGCDAAGSMDFLISDPAVWSGVELAQSDFIALRDRSVTPATASTPATSWWTLQGTALANPTTADAGMHDQMAAANHFITLPGAGGSTTNAAYSATNLVYLPPMTIAEAIVCRSGDIVKFSIGTNPLLGAVTPVYFTAVNARPTISVNGTPVTGANLQGPFWSSFAFDDPWVMYQIVGGVGPTDVVTYSTPDSWVSTASGAAAPESGTCGNYTGGFEPGCFGYTGFNPPDSWKKLKLGFNVVGGGSFTGAPTVAILKNSAHRFGRSWLFATMSPTIPGLPTAIASTSNYTAFTTVWQPNSFSGIGNQGFPVPTGTWVFVADETNPSHPMTPNLTGNSGVLSITAHTPATIAGTIDPATGFEMGKQWLWDVAYTNPGSSSIWANTIGFSIQAPIHTGATQPQTLVNFKLFEPGNAFTAGNIENVMNDNYVAKMTAAPGVYPAVIRSMEGLAGSDGASALLNAADYPSNATRVSYGGPAIRTVADWTVNEPTFTGNRIIPIYATRRYQPSPAGASSQYVYAAQNYLGTTASLNPAFAYQWDLTALGLGYDWMQSKPNVVNGELVAVEFVVADVSGNPINHNLQSGQIVAIGGIAALPCTNSSSPSGSPVCVPNLTAIAWVTGPNTFIVVSGTNMPSGTTSMGWLTSTVTTTWASATCTVIPTAIEYAIEDYGGFARGLPGSGIWFAVNHCATDAAVLSLATRLFNATPRGTKIFIQFSNEILIPNFQFGWVNQVASLMQLTSNAQVDIQRTGEVHTIFETVWGADAGSLVRIFQPFSVDPTTARIAFDYAQAHSIKIDAVALATYADMDPAPSFKMAAAALCVNENITYPANTGGTPALTPQHVSIAYTAGPGGGLTPDGSPLPLMPMAAFADMYRHHLKYRKFFNGPTGQNANMYNAMVASGYGTGVGSGWTYPLPIFIGYECNVSTAIPPGVSLATRIVRGGLTLDVMAHPSFYDVTNAFLQHLQEPGPVGTPGGYTYACIEALDSTRGFAFTSVLCSDNFSDGGSAECWGDMVWQGQRAGRGLSNSFWAQDLGGDGNVHDYNNASVNGQAHLDWILAASGGVAATVATMAATERHDSAAALGRGPAVAVMAVTGRPDSAVGLSFGTLAPAIAKVSPSRIPVNTLGATITADQSVTLNLVGVSTNWTSGSTVTVTNSVTGTTTVTKGTWTRLSATTATLTVTTGLGSGTWHLTVDGIVSPTLVVGSRHHGWPGRMNRPRLALRA